MSTIGSASRYAEDFLRDFTRDWQRFEDALNTSEELREYLDAPAPSLDEKKQLLRQVFEDSLDPFTLSFLGLLLEQGLLASAAQIGGVAEAMLKRWSEMLTVRLTTAVPLPATEEQELLNMLQKRYGKEILLEKTVDENIIGGAVLRIGDKLFDGSIKSQLKALERDLLK